MFSGKLFFDHFNALDVLVEVILADRKIDRVRVVIRNFVISFVVVGHVIGDGGAGMHPGGKTVLEIEYKNLCKEKESEPEKIRILVQEFAPGAGRDYTKFQFGGQSLVSNNAY